MDNLVFEANATLLPETERQQAILSLKGWSLLSLNGINQLQRRYKLNDFASGLELANKLGELAEKFNHHPTIELKWGLLTLNWWTHSLKGLTRNDFYMATKSDEIVQAFLDKTSA